MGASFVQVKFSAQKIMYVHVLPVARKSWIKIQWYVGKAVEYSEWQVL